MEDHINKTHLSTGRKIKLARIDRGFTQQQLADKLNVLLPSKVIVERSMISRWEKGVHFPSNERKLALEVVLQVQLNNPPKRALSGATYIPYQDQITDRLGYVLKDCQEIWVTSTSSQVGAWKEISTLHDDFEALRKSKECLVKELYYIQKIDDMKKIEKLIASNYPNYRLGVRLAPGQPLPIIYSPDKSFGLLLSSSDDNLRNVGLELDGKLASFCEHTFRYRWIYAQDIISEDGTVHHDRVVEIKKRLTSLGRSIHEELSHK